MHVPWRSRLIADEFGARERPEKNTDCSHFLHEITARSFPDEYHGSRTATPGAFLKFSLLQ